MKNLIVSLDSYSWVKYCAYDILEDPKNFEVIIVCSDVRPMLACKDLCEEAIYEQRRHDVKMLGKELKLKKIINLQHDTNNVDMIKLAAQLQLHVLFGTTMVYYQHTFMLDKTLKEIKKRVPHLQIQAYDTPWTVATTHIENKDITNLGNLMVGIAYENEKP